MTFPEYVKKWITIQSNTASQQTINANLRSLTAGYVATTDTPMIQYTEELTRLYPKAIVICTTRERSAWYESSEALNKNTMLWWLDLVFWPMPTLRWFGRWRDTIGERLEKVYRTSKSNMGGPGKFPFSYSQILDHLSNKITYTSQNSSPCTKTTYGASFPPSDSFSSM